MQINGKDVYFVAVKVLLRDGDKLLLIHDKFGAWDIPGGRLKEDEFDAPFEEVIARKMREELGDKVRYTLGEQKVFFRHQRIEAEINERVRIFAVGYEAKYEGGEIELGDYMEKYEWADVNQFNPRDYLEGGWLKGVEEYLEGAAT